MDLISLNSSISQIRNELRNIRKTMSNMRHEFRNQFTKLERFIVSVQPGVADDKCDMNESQRCHSDELIKKNITPSLSNEIFCMKPIGKIESLHRFKNGTPRQGSVSDFSRGRLRIDKTIFNNPAHSLEGLQSYSHVWLLFVFHQNTSVGSHAKVSLPRLKGEKVGLFASRSPHRPNPIGLTLARLEAVEGDTLTLSGIDIVNGTPILDVKPFIPSYDTPKVSESIIEPKGITDDSKGHEETSMTVALDRCKVSPDSSKELPGVTSLGEEISRTECPPCGDLRNDPHTGSEGVLIPDWIGSKTKPALKVIFNPVAERQIEQFTPDAEDSKFRLEFLKTDLELRCAIASLLSEDPRSTYRSLSCSDRLYFLEVDAAHVTACFFDDVAEVLRVRPRLEDK